MKPSRKTHKDRYSITHLSTETTATLPEYVPASTTTMTTPWQPPRHSRNQQHAAGRTLLLDQEGLLSDQPPEYPDSADEADEETDSVLSEMSDNVQLQGRPLLLPPHPPSDGASGGAAATRSPRHHGKRISLSTSPPDQFPSSYHHYTHDRHRQFYNSNRPYLHHPRKFRSTAALPYPPPAEDPYLDSLLERSVHALEMSNTLLQSSVSTRTTLPTRLKTPVLESYESKWVVGEEEEGEEDETEVGMNKFEEGANGLTKRTNVHEERREQWVDDLEKIKRDVEGLFGVGGEDEEDRWEGSSTGRGRQKRRNSDETGVSQSLPVSPSSSVYKHRPSQLDLQETPRLTYSSQYHSRLVSPAPGALTQFIAAPGAESAPSTRMTTPASQSTVNLHSAPVMPQVTDRLPEPTTPAYNMLASFVHRSPPGTSSTPASFTSPSVFRSLLPKLRPRASSSSGTEKDRRSLIDHLRPTTSDRPHGHQPMTPPAEVSTGSSSSSSEDLIAKQTVMSLRKILDEQPARPTKKKYKPPAFMPITPAPAPQASTSNATASVSRLFTKAIHTSSTRPPSPPKHSALKHGPGSRSSISPTQQIQSTPSTSSGVELGISMNWPTKSSLMKAQFGMLPEILSAGVAKAFGATPMTASGSNSATSSGRSTPKRISFAELPEVDRPQGTSLRFKEKQARRRRRRSKGLSIVSGNEDGTGATLADAIGSSSPPIGGGWWSGWLGGDNGGGGLAGMGGGNTGMYVSRLEERVSRPWSGADRPGIGFGDWAM